MRKVGLTILILLIMLSIISCAKKAAKPSETVEGVPVGVIKPEMKDIVVYYDTSATVKAKDVRELSFTVPGKIASLSKDNGEKIRSGEVLAMLDRATYQSALNAAESGLQAARNGLAAAEQQKKASENQLKDAENRLAQIEKDYQRLTKLHDQKVITDKEFEEIELGYKSATLGVESARSALKMAESQVSSAEEGVKASTAQRDMSKKQFDDAVLSAPFNGTVNKKFLDEGAVVNPGEGIYEIVADGGMKIEATLPERYMNEVKEGSIVLVSIPEIQCNLLPQPITLVHREINKDTGNFGVTIDLKDVDGCLRHGMFAHLSFEVARHDKVLTVPVMALIELSEGSVVYIVENGKAIKRQVVTGLTTKDDVEIASGLQGGEDVILSGNRYVVDGSAVRVTGKENAEAGVPNSQ